MFVDALIHPVFRLLITTVVEIAVCLDKVNILVDHIPDFLDAIAVETAVAQHLRQPAALGHGEEMQRIAEIGGRHVTLVDIIAIALIDDNGVANLHDPALDALQVVAGTCQLDEQEEVNHRVARRLALAHTYRLDENLVETSRLTKDDRLARLAGHTTQRTSRRTGADEGIRMYAEFLHARLVAQNTTLRTLRRGVDGQHSQPATLLFQHMDAKLVDTRRFACARHATDAYTDAVATIGQTFVDDLLRLGLMVGINTLHQCHSLRKHSDITLDDTLHHIGSREFAATDALALQIGIDDGRLLNTTVDLQACVF